MTSYRTFGRGQKAKYWVVSKERYNGHHVATPYRSKPKNIRKGQEVVVSGGRVDYKTNKNGYATPKHLPDKNIQSKRRPVVHNSMFGSSLSSSFGGSMFGKRRKGMFDF